MFHYILYMNCSRLLPIRATKAQSIVPGHAEMWVSGANDRGRNQRLRDSRELAPKGGPSGRLDPHLAGLTND